MWPHQTGLLWILLILSDIADVIWYWEVTWWLIDNDDANGDDDDGYQQSGAGLLVM